MSDDDVGHVTALMEAPRIVRLPQDVVNRIAAGEVVVSPAAALKELLENSLDAGATSITVSVRGGGAKLLQVADNGRGIAAEDLPLLCERHATSKLRVFDDLVEVATFGFRGEALASVSHVARVSVLTKTAEDMCARTAKYIDGVICGTPTLSAGLDGTTLSVEDLFYNLPARRRALRAVGEEYRAIVDIVSRYAIKYAGVAFVCRRLTDSTGRSSGGSTNSGGPDVRTVIGASIRDNIRAAFGSSLAQELLLFDVTLAEQNMSASIYATNPGFRMKKAVFVMFVNGRLVNCGPLKRAVDAAYSAHLPKGAHAFLYIDLTMRQIDVDVNVHPNKTEVRFLNEAELVEAVVDGLEAKLKIDGKSRTFLAQALISNDGGIAKPTSYPAPICTNPSLTPWKHKVCVSSLIKNSESSASDGGGEPVHQAAKRLRKQLLPNGPYDVAKFSATFIDVEAVDGGLPGDDAESDSEGVPNEQDEKFIDDAEDSEGDGDDDNVGVPLMSRDMTEQDGGDADVTNDGDPKDDIEKAGESEDADDAMDVIGKSDGVDHNDVVGESPPESPVITRSNQQEPRTQTQKKRIASKDKVRTDRLAPVGAMDAFYSHSNGPSPAIDLRQRRQRRPNALPMLTSIQEAIAELQQNVHHGAAEILREHAFVGVASDRYALIQHQTKLMLVDVVPVVTELMYGQILLRFADMDAVTVMPPAPLMQLLSLAIHGDGEGAKNCETEKDAQDCIRVLLDKAPMLSEYFSIKITGTSPEHASLEGLPAVFAGMAPDLSRSPEFFLSLATDVDWTAERPCLLGIAQALARLYGEGWFPNSILMADSQPPNGSHGPSIDAEMPHAKHQRTPTVAEQREWYLRHVLFESLRTDFDPSASLAGALREVTSTQKLYRIFERC
jgi:DNA mismatch repair protein MLH1